MTKTNKLVRLFEEFSIQKSILILNFDPVSVSTPGTEDKYARGYKRADSLLIELAEEKGLDAVSLQYDKVVIDGEEIYIGEKRLCDFDYVIMGMMAKKTEIVNPILQYLEKHGVPHFNYGTPSDRGNKLQDMYNLIQAGLPYVPSFVTANSTEAVKYVTKHWKGEYPVVCKVMNASQGDGVSKCDSAEELEKAFSNPKDPTYEDFRMVQKFIPNEGDYRVLIFCDKIIATAKRVSKDPKKEFRNNMSKGGSGFVAELSHEASQLALDSVKTLEKEMAGVDLIQDKNTGKWFIMEVNSAPQYHYFQEISGTDFPQMLIDKIYSELYGTTRIERA
jgi:ribosomal protein S6--L-glutamate ligase